MRATFLQLLQTEHVLNIYISNIARNKINNVQLAAPLSLLPSLCLNEMIYILVEPIAPGASVPRSKPFRMKLLLFLSQVLHFLYSENCQNKLLGGKKKKKRVTLNHIVSIPQPDGI